MKNMKKELKTLTNYNNVEENTKRSHNYLFACSICRNFNQIFYIKINIHYFAG